MTAFDETDLNLERRRRRPGASPADPALPGLPVMPVAPAVPTAPLAPAAPAVQADPHAAVVRYQAPAQQAHTFAAPEDEFPFWAEIFDAVTAEFVERSRTAKVDELIDEGAYYELVASVVERRPEWVSPAEYSKLVRLLRRYQFGYWGLENYLSLPDLEEVYFNDYQTGFYIQGGQKHKITDRMFRDEDAIQRFIKKVATENGLQINLSRPALDARLRDGSRLHASLPPLAVNGAQFVIRKHRDIPFTIDQYIDNGMVTAELAGDLQRMVHAGWTIVVSGGTGSGKTSFLNTIGNAFLPASERLVICEDTHELKIQTDDTEYLQAQRDTSRDVAEEGEINISDLIRFALRMRPDRIIVGEVRGTEALDVLKAWNSGHDGSFCTVHADSAELAISKLEQLARSGGDLDQQAIRELLATTVNCVVQVTRRAPGPNPRAVVQVVQIVHPLLIDFDDEGVADRYRQLKDSGEIHEMRGVQTLPLYRFDRRRGHLVKRNDPLPVLGKEF